MIEYVIFGTSHVIQESLQFANQVEKCIRECEITLVAEEFPFEIVSKVHAVATSLNIPYLQIDLFPYDWRTYHIDYEMAMRLDAGCLAGLDVRLSHADEVREELWLQKIEKNIERRRVLIVCGYLHLHYLAIKINNRGDKILDQKTYPSDLLNRTPDKIFTLMELREYLENNL